MPTYATSSRTSVLGSEGTEDKQMHAHTNGPSTQNTNNGKNDKNQAHVASFEKPAHTMNRCYMLRDSVVPDFMTLYVPLECVTSEFHQMLETLNCSEFPDSTERTSDGRLWQAWNMTKELVSQADKALHQAGYQNVSEETV